MKTLKKTLCLVLAVVMVVGALILPAHAADATTEDADATAAFKTLLDYGVMVGVDTKNTPALDKNINRQDMAAIIYRVMTGDTANKYVANYANAAKEFADSATFADWAKGYIGYVGSKGIFKGDDKGNFKPTEEIKGCDVLTVLLRCIGYGQNGEFTGPDYAANAKAQAADIKMFGGATNYKNVAEQGMDKIINRGTVAKLVFNAIQAPMVTYFNGNYSAYQNNGLPVAPNAPDKVLNPSLIKLDTATTSTYELNEWGAPTVTTKKTLYFNKPIPAVTVDKSVVTSKPLTDSWVAMSQCDLATALKLTKSTGFDVYTNGKENLTTTTVNPLNTTAQIGAQGRYTAVYDNPAYAADKTLNPYILVYKDTLLAQVKSVTEATYDAANHLRTQATMVLDVYDALNATTEATFANGSTNWTYSAGDMLLLNYHQSSITSAKAVATAAFAASKTWKNYYTIVGTPESFTGAQTVYSLNGNAHTIDGNKIPDNNRYHKDAAGSTMKVGFTWYKDTKGNIIGSSAIAAVNNYGVITRIYWASTGTGTGTVYADVTYVDGTTVTVVVSSIESIVDAGDEAQITSALLHKGAAVNSDSGNAAMTWSTVNGKEVLHVSQDSALNENDIYGIVDGHLFKITTGATGCTFVEVGGNGTPAAGNGQYTGMYNLKSQAITKNVYAQGTALKIDANTKFLIRSGSAPAYTYTPVTGFANIVNYTAGEVDYVNTDTDDAAEIVFIKAAPETAVGWHIFFADAKVTSDQNNDAPMMRIDDNGTTYTVYGYLDGVAGSVTIKKTDTVIATDFVNVMNGNTLWFVKIQGGYVVDVNGANTNHAAGWNLAVNGSYVQGGSTSTAYRQGTTAFNTGLALNDTTNGMGTADNSIYKDLSLVMALDVTAPILANGNIMTIGGVNLNTSNSNMLVVGDINMLKAASTTYKVNVVAVYKSSADKTITQLYVWSNDDGTEYNPGTTLAEKTTYTIGLQSDGKNIGGEVALYTNTSKGTAADALKAALANANEVKVATFGTGDEHTFKAVASKPEQAEIAFANSTAGFTVSALTITSASEFTTKVYVGDYIVIAWAASDTTPTHFAAFKVVA